MARRGLLVDFGGVLTTDVFSSFQAFCEAEGLEPDTVRERFRGDPAAQRLLFDLEEGKLTFEESALRAIARKALKRGTGARGLRAILEELMTDIMFDLPSRDDIVEVKITEGSVMNGTPPLLEISPKRQKKEA